MLETLRIRYRLLRRRSRQWLDRHPRVDRLLHSTGALGTRDGALARGVFVGLFIALLPLFGVQTLLIVAGCILVRGNFPVGFAVSWVNNPFTVAPLYITYNVIGETLFGPVLTPAVALSGTEREMVLEILYLGAGGLCVAVPAAVLGYGVMSVLERRMEARRRAREADDRGEGNL